MSQSWSETIAKLCTELEQAKWVMISAVLRAENERQRADAAEQALHNYIALAPFNSQRAPEIEPKPARPVDLWPAQRRRPVQGIPIIPRPRPGTR